MTAVLNATSAVIFQRSDRRASRLSMSDFYQGRPFPGNPGIGGEGVCGGSTSPGVRARGDIGAHPVKEPAPALDG